MKVIDPRELIFSCHKDEEGTMSMTCDNTLFGINFRFRPAVPHSFSSDSDSGLIKFTVTQDTDLIINFNYSGQVGGVYNCALTDVEDFENDTFPHEVQQFGSLLKGRTYSFLLK